MSTLRLPYFKLSADVFKGFLHADAGLEKSSLGRNLIELIYTRVSQINGCAYCLGEHGKALKELGESDRRIYELAGWRTSSAFSEKERVALEWAEALTQISSSHAEDEVYLPLKEHFSDVEVSDLTLAISLINAFNRVAIAMRQ